MNISKLQESPFAIHHHMWEKWDYNVQRSLYDTSLDQANRDSELDYYRVANSMILDSLITSATQMQNHFISLLPLQQPHDEP